jgi:alkaline phosphatase D
MKNTLLLAALGSRAFHEFMPLRFTPSEPGRVYRKISYGPLLDLFMLDMRSYRGPNKAPHAIQYGPDAYLLGPVQLAWFKRELKRSTAIWKVIASDTPLGTIAASSPDAGATAGRGVEIAELLAFMQQAGIRNTVWITADLHYTAAHFFDPNKAIFQNFEPFWEFVSADPRGNLDSVRARPHVWPIRCISERREPRTRRQSRALFWSAVFWIHFN